MNLPVASTRLGLHAPFPSADYLTVSWGQAHRLQSLPADPRGEAATAGAAPPLYALHGTAYSGRTFAPLMTELPGRRIVALDTPGYGGSTRPSEPWTVEQYAEALSEAISAGGERQVDLLGYHTGALLALQVAAARPALVRRLVLIGAPYFPDPEARSAWRAKLAEPMRLTERLDQFEERWDFLVAGRAPGASLEQGFAHFVDELRAWPYGFWAHEAAFTFDPSACVAQVRQPTLVLVPDTPLAEPSRQLARRLTDAQVVELPHLSHGVLDIAAPDLAHAIEPFLSR
jgi:pimeloyl-ACP methyl ester carboxylesterase